MPILLLRIAVLVLLAASGWVAARQLIALEIYRAYPNEEGLELALAWDPSNPDLHFYRASLENRVLDLQLQEQAGKDLETAIALNPHNWLYRQGLGRYLELQGNPEKALESYRKALELNPKNAFFEWTLGNFLLRQGETSTALEHLENALAWREEYRQPGVDLLFRLGIPEADLKRVWPKDHHAMVRLLMYSVARADRLHEAWSDELIEWAADSVFNSPSDPIVLQFVRPYIEYLWSKGDYQRARFRWAQWAESNDLGDPAFLRKDNYVWDGDFEKPLSHQAFDWKFATAEGFEVRKELDGQNRSQVFRVKFDGGQPLPFNLVWQEVIVDPGGTYHFSFRARSDAIQPEGLFFEVRDYATGNRLATEPIRGTTSWSTYQGTIETGPETQLLRIQLRAMGELNQRLSGRIWIDDVVLKRSGP